MAEEDYLRMSYEAGYDPFDNPEIEEYLFTAGETDPEETDEFIDLEIEEEENNEEDEDIEQDE